MRIYVAGPYTPRGVELHDVSRVTHQNVLSAIEAGKALIRKGHWPCIPHLTHFIYLECAVEVPPNLWYSYGMEWLKQCEGLLFLGHSIGANRERHEAEELGLPIWESIEEVPDENA